MDEPIYTTNVRRWGQSYVFILPKAVRELLGVVPGDLIGIRRCGRYVIVKRLRAGEVMPLSEEEARKDAQAVRG